MYLLLSPSLRVPLTLLFSPSTSLSLLYFFLLPTLSSFYFACFLLFFLLPAVSSLRSVSPFSLSPFFSPPPPPLPPHPFRSLFSSPCPLSFQLPQTALPTPLGPAGRGRERNQPSSAATSLSFLPFLSCLPSLLIRPDPRLLSLSRYPLPTSLPLAPFLAPTHPDVTPPHSPLSLATPALAQWPPQLSRVGVGGLGGVRLRICLPRPLRGATWGAGGTAPTSSAPQCEKKGRGLRGVWQAKGRGEGED